MHRNGVNINIVAFKGSARSIVCRALDTTRGASLACRCNSVEMARAAAYALSSSSDDDDGVALDPGRYEQADILGGLAHE